MRLVQHTLPLSVSVDEIVRKNRLARSSNDDDTDTDAMTMRVLRDCVGDMYDACYSHAVRALGCRRLQALADASPSVSRSEPKRSSDAPRLAIRDLAHSDSCDRISFVVAELELDADADKKRQRRQRQQGRLLVQLSYDDQLLCAPTNVRLVLNDGCGETKELVSNDDATGHRDDDDDYDYDDRGDEGIRRRRRRRADGRSDGALQSIAATFRILDAAHAVKRTMIILQKEIYFKDCVGGCVAVNNGQSRPPKIIRVDSDPEIIYVDSD